MRPLLQGRRRVLRLAVAGSLAAGPLAACSSRIDRIERGPLAVLLDTPGEAGADPSATNEHAQLLRALAAVQTARHIPLQVRVLQPAEDPQAVLRSLAAADVRMVVSVGERFDTALAQVAKDWPQQRFTTLGGRLASPALACYRLREEEVAWLAGLLAARIAPGGSIAVHFPTPGSRFATESPASVSGQTATTPPWVEAFRRGARRADAAVRVQWIGARRTPATLVEQLEREGVTCVCAALDPSAPEVAAAFSGSRVRLIAREGDGTAPAVSAPWLAARTICDRGALVDRLSGDIVDGVWRSNLERSFGLRQASMLRLERSAGLEPALDTSIAAELDIAAYDIMAGRIPVTIKP